VTSASAAGELHSACLGCLGQPVEADPDTCRRCASGRLM
jgi:hypothetical protein